MCGRFSLGLDPDEIRCGIGEYFPRLRGGGAGGEDPAAAATAGGPTRQATRQAALPWDGEDRFRPRNWNVAPRSNSVVLRYRRTGEGNREDEERKGVEADGPGELVLQTMQWGLIPHWSKHPPQGPLNTINARCENLTDPGAGGMWQSLKGHKRCVVVVEGYYEWQKKGTTKIPHFTRLAPGPSASHPLMLLAGLWDRVTYTPTAEDPDPQPHYTFTILTTTPSARLRFLHDRMPVVLDAAGAERWMDTRDGWTNEVARLCRPYEGEVECYPVQSEVGKVGTNSSSYIVPVAERKDGIASFFKKQEAKSPAKARPEPTGASPAKRETEAADTRQSGCTSKTAHGAVHEPVTDGADDKPAKREELEADGLDAGIGDDSNAPQADAKPAVKGRDAGDAPKMERSERKPSQRGSTGSRKRAAESPDGVVVIDDEEAAEPARPSAKRRAKKEEKPAYTATAKRQTRSSRSSQR